MAQAAVLKLPLQSQPEPPAAPTSLRAKLKASLNLLIDQERTAFLHWVPVALGLGMAAYFALPVEPPLVVIVLALACLSGCALFSHLRGPLLIAAMLPFIGFAAAQMQTRAKTQPLLAAQQQARTYIATVAKIERRVEGGWRLVLEDIGAPGETPRLPSAARITVRTDIPDTLQVGTRIRTRAVLMPLPKPVRPGGYDFGRALFFKGIGATGFAVADITALGTPALEDKPSLIEQARNKVREEVSAVLEGDTRGVALALLTGDRAGISAQTRDAYRQAGLAHLLAISGLHMALIAGAVFFAVRRGLTLWPRLALALPLKGCAAGATIVALLAYLALVGAPVSAQRATIMASAAMLAIMVGRDAISMRTAALAAIALLLLAPHSVLDIGFQMSFAAVIALIAGYEAFAPKAAALRASSHWIMKGPGLYMFGVFSSTILAELAITPLTIYHFNEITLYGLAGNALAVPLTGFVIMPAGILGIVLLPFGLSEPAFWVMGQGIDLMTLAATDVASQPHALLPVRRLSGISHACLLAGFLWLCLWRSRLRFIGLCLLLPAALFAYPGPKPDLILSDTGKAIAAKTSSGDLLLLAGRSSSFASDVWARSLGQNDLSGDEDMYLRCDKIGCFTTFQQGMQQRGFSLQALEAGPDAHQGIAIDFLKHPSGWQDACQKAHIVVVQFASKRRCSRSVLTLDQAWLKQNGPVELTFATSAEMAERQANDALNTFAWPIVETQSNPLKTTQVPKTSTTNTDKTLRRIVASVKTVSHSGRPWQPILER
ncbi:MAG: ComEC/Rec2 family competence protein [Pseudomonadota bacterium]